MIAHKAREVESRIPIGIRIDINRLSSGKVTRVREREAEATALMEGPYKKVSEINRQLSNTWFLVMSLRRTIQLISVEVGRAMADWAWTCINR